MTSNFQAIASQGDNKNMFRLLMILLVVIILGAFASNGILIRPDNLSNILQQNAVLLVIVGAQFLVVVTGGFDLSVGAAVAVASVVFVTALDLGPEIALAAALGSGLLLGILNGAIVTFVRLPSFVVTLATMQIAYSAARLVTGGGTIDASRHGATIPPEWLTIYSADLLGIPLPVWIAIAVVALIVIYLRTATGHFVYAIGGNTRAAFLAGAPVSFTRLATYSIASLIASIGGVLFALRVGYGDPQAGLSLSLDSIAAVSLGGVSLVGGRGSVFAAVIGVLILALLDNLMNLLGVSVLLQPVVKGTIIILTVWAYSLKRESA